MFPPLPRGGPAAIVERMRSALYSAFAYATFLAVSAWAVLFLAGVGPLPAVDSPRTGPAWAAVLVDLGLWLLFGLQHSVLARDRARLSRSTYVLTTSVVLGLLFWQWRALPATVWHLPGQPWVALVWGLYAVGWVTAVAATYMIDHWEFLGLRPAAGSVSLSRRWLYGSVRHPMMTGLLLAFWATPVLTAGHLLFALAGTAYIAVGVHFEERDLRRDLGPAYAEYAREVPRFVPRSRPAPVR